MAYMVYFVVTVSDVTAFASGSSPANAISVEDGTEEVEIDLEKALEVNSAVAVEKEIAADTLGTLFVATREQFLPFVEQTALELMSLLSHYYEGIRKSSTDSLLKIIRTFYDLSGQPEWQPGANVVRKCHREVHSTLFTLTMTISAATLEPNRQRPD
jgi:hypothetical protein